MIARELTFISNLAKKIKAKQKRLKRKHDFFIIEK